MYQLTNTTSIKRLADGAIIPENKTLSDWAVYQDWLKAGNTPIPMDTTPIKPLMWQRIKAERDRRIQDGGYKVGTKWYHSDTFSRTQQMGLVMMGANIPANTPWKTMDGSFVVMTQTLAGQIFGAAAASDIAIFSAAETHRAAMEASADPAAYDFTGGWPPMFGA